MPDTAARAFRQGRFRLRQGKKTPKFPAGGILLPEMVYNAETNRGGRKGMTTINTPEDLLRGLSENAEWRAAMRVQIVGDELMNMPPAFYAFMEKVSGFITEQMQFNAEMRQFVADQVDSSTRLELRMDNMARDVNELKEGFSTLSRRVDHLSTSFDRLRDDVGDRKSVV